MPASPFSMCFNFTLSSCMSASTIVSVYELRTELFSHAYYSEHLGSISCRGWLHHFIRLLISRLCIVSLPSARRLPPAHLPATGIAKSGTHPHTRTACTSPVQRVSEAGKVQRSIHPPLSSLRSIDRRQGQARRASVAAMGMGGSRARQNAMRSGVVVLGAVAFGYLSFRVGFKPYLDQAQEAIDSARDADTEPAAAAVRDASDDPAGAGPEEDLAPSKDPAVVLRD